VLLTVATLVLGLIPMAMHLSIDLINREIIYGGTVTSFWVPLTRSICFGLSFATVLTLVVTPAMLALPYRLREVFAPLIAPLVVKVRGLRPSPAPSAPAAPAAIAGGGGGGGIAGGSGQPAQPMAPEKPAE
jgi:hypothetical protein